MREVRGGAALDGDDIPVVAARGHLCGGKVPSQMQDFLGGSRISDGCLRGGALPWIEEDAAAGRRTWPWQRGVRGASSEEDPAMATSRT